MINMEQLTQQDISKCKIKTYTGKLVNPLDLQLDDIDIFDIAHSLAYQCRFTGHTKFFYSVAQHSILVASIVPMEYKLAALLHDASEAYLHDIPRPLKRLEPFKSFYKHYEDKIMQQIYRKFGVDGYMDYTHYTEPQVSFDLLTNFDLLEKEIKKADNILALTELRDLMGCDLYNNEEIRQCNINNGFNIDLFPLPYSIIYQSPEQTEKQFLYLFDRL